VLVAADAVEAGSIHQQIGVHRRVESARMRDRRRRNSGGVTPTIVKGTALMTSTVRVRGRPRRGAGECQADTTNRRRASRCRCDEQTPGGRPIEPSE
jgi:hypothetical protein